MKWEVIYKKVRDVVAKKLFQYYTWKENTGFIYSPDDLTEKLSFSYSGEGWGLTHDGNHLILSNGSATLSFIDPETFQVVRTVDVTYDDAPVPDLNELEYIDGLV